MFSPGDLVRCINDNPNNPEAIHNYDRWITKDYIYSVRGTIEMLDGIDGLYLEGINGVVAFCKDVQKIVEFSFDSRRFVKLGEDQLRDINDEEEFSASIQKEQSS